MGVDGDGYIWAWDVAREKLVFRADTGTPVHFVSFSSREERLAAAARDRSVRLFDLSLGKEIVSLPTQAKGVALSPDGLKAAVAVVDDTVVDDTIVEIWDCVKGSLLRSLTIHGSRFVANSTIR